MNDKPQSCMECKLNDLSNALGYKEGYKQAEEDWNNRIRDMVEELTKNIKCFYFSDDEPTRYFQAEEVMAVIYKYLYKETK